MNNIPIWECTEKSHNQNHTVKIHESLVMASVFQLNYASRGNRICNESELSCKSFNISDKNSKLHTDCKPYKSIRLGVAFPVYSNH